MKYIIFLSSLLLISSCFTTRQIPNPRKTISGILDLKGFDADKIFDQSSMYFAKNYTGQNFILRSRDARHIYYKCSFGVEVSKKCTSLWNAEFEIYIKDGRCKYIVSNIDHYDVICRSKYENRYFYLEDEIATFYGSYWPTLQKKVEERIHSDMKGLEVYIKTFDENW